jgi:hypothetical protein
MNRSKLWSGYAGLFVAGLVVFSFVRALVPNPGAGRLILSWLIVGGLIYAMIEWKRYCSRDGDRLK